MRIAWRGFLPARVLTCRQADRLPVAVSLLINGIGVASGRVMAMGSLIAIHG